MEIPDGKYRGMARGAAPALIESGKGTPGVSVEVVFSDPSLAGASLTWTGWLSEGAFDRTIESLRTMGWTGIDLDTISGLDANEVELVVKAEEYEGNVYPRIQFINRIGGAMGAEMSAEKKKTFAASMRDRIRAIDAGKGAGPARDTRKAPPQQQRQVASASGARQAPRGGAYDPRDIPPGPPPSPGGEHDNDDIPF